jgi:hypothetical protein
MMEMEDGTSKQFEMYENLSEFIENYEAAKKTKKDLANKKKGIEKFMEE